ncbi:hypothetical protein BGZ94_005430, partial [Podila epigama]
MVFGRFDVASSTNNSAGLNIYSAFHSRRHGASRLAIKQRFTHSERGQRLLAHFATPILSSTASYCRRHHRKDCQRTCCTLAKLQHEQQMASELKKKLANNYYMNNATHGRKLENAPRVTGLVDAIPAFLKCSAMSYRDIENAEQQKQQREAKEKEKEKDKEKEDVSMQVDKQTDEKTKEDSNEMDSSTESSKTVEPFQVKVQEGWYQLLVEMMTQAVIESYLCDESTGFDVILDVFSFGDDPDARDRHEETTTTALLNDSVNMESFAVNGVEDLQFHSSEAVTTSGSSSAGTGAGSGGHSGSTTVNGHSSSSIGINNSHDGDSTGPAAAAAAAAAAAPHPSHGGLPDVTTQDRQDDILFGRKTEEYKAFLKRKEARLDEFLELGPGQTMESHFAEMVDKYPLIVFERQMTHFIARSQQLLVDPKLSQ